MKRALFITIGTRDVGIDKATLVEKTDAKKVKTCYKKHPNGKEVMLARPAGKLINDHFDSLKNAISLPIIDPFLKYTQ
jgi:hypothetical protein